MRKKKNKRNAGRRGFRFRRSSPDRPARDPERNGGDSVKGIPDTSQRTDGGFRVDFYAGQLKPFAERPRIKPADKFVKLHLGWRIGITFAKNENRPVPSDPHRNASVFVAESGWKVGGLERNAFTKTPCVVSQGERKKEDES